MGLNGFIGPEVNEENIDSILLGFACVCGNLDIVKEKLEKTPY